MKIISSHTQRLHTILDSIEAWENHLESGVMDLDFIHKMSGFMTTLVIDEVGSLSEMMALGGLAESKGDAKRIIKSGGALVNAKKVKDPFYVLTQEDVLFDHWVIIGRGKDKRTLFFV